MLKPLPQEPFFRVRPSSELFINQQNAQPHGDLFVNSHNFDDFQTTVGIDNLPGSINPHSSASINAELNYCPVCNQSFILPSMLLEHMHIHQNYFLLGGLENNFNFTCQQCDESFRSALELDEHMRSMHQILNFSKCSNCSLYGISTVTGPESKCLHCGAPNHEQTDSEFSKSKRKQISNQLQNNGNECCLEELSMNNESGNMSNINTFHKPKPKILQNTINKAFFKLQNDYELNEDIKPNAGTPTNRRHKCPDCDKTFKTIATLNFHKRVHTGEAELQAKERPYICAYCSKTFTQSNTLKQHTRIHTGEKPFQCSYCEKSFSVKDYLTKHIRTHTGEKPYSCVFCKKKFTQRSALTVHTSKLHPI